AEHGAVFQRLQPGTEAGRSAGLRGRMSGLLREGSPPTEEREARHGATPTLPGKGKHFGRARPRTDERADRQPFSQPRNLPGLTTSCDVWPRSAHEIVALGPSRHFSHRKGPERSGRNV